MKKSILRIAAALFTIFLTLAALGMAKRVLGRKDSEFKYKPFFRTNTEYDVLFFGTSHVIDGIFPMQLWHDYGITSYNFGEHGTPIPTSYWIMRNAVRYHKPKIAALDINSIVEDKKMMKNWIFRTVLVNKKSSLRRELSKRQKGVEPSSSAWKAEIMSRYMTAENVSKNIPTF